MSGWQMLKFGGQDEKGRETVCFLCAYPQNIINKKLKIKIRGVQVAKISTLEQRNIVAARDVGYTKKTEKVASPLFSLFIFYFYLCMYLFIYLFAFSF